ncbi:hypothetical protein RJ641_027042 [Dillenia turbinata]|uniref:Uncharacterized protein n=1 Tax=Dillenia turbinata TaxID=194707 RepID=A0AAN8VXK3_9MAGN
MASATAGLYGGKGGTGGKLQNPSRRPAASLYARPMNQSKTAAKRRLWWMAFKNCTSRSVSQSRFLPSFFSPSLPQLESTNTVDHRTNKCLSNPKQKIDNEGPNCDLRLDPSRSLGEAGPSKEADQLGNLAASDEDMQEKEDNICDNCGLSMIEELLKGKNFSRDEINHLTEILHSRAANLSNSEGEKKEASSLVGKIDNTLLTLENPGETSKKMEEEQNRSAWGMSTPHLQLTLSIACALDYSHIMMQGLLSHLLLRKCVVSESSLSYYNRTCTIIPDEISASPVDIAKAYTGSRMTETGLASQNVISKKGSLLLGDESASKPFFPSPSPKPSICWPGAMVQEHSGHMTTEVRRGNFRNFSEPLTQDLFFPSHGPRRKQYKLEDFYALAKISNFCLWTVTSSSSEYFSPNNKPDSFEMSMPTAHPWSTLMAKQILEHLDRTVPSPKDKAAELKFASSWRKAARSEVATIFSNEQIRSRHAAFFDSDKNASLVGHSLSEGNQDKGNSFSEVQMHDRTGNEAAHSIDNATSASNVLGKSGTSSGSAA